MTNEEAIKILNTLNIQGGRRNGKALIIEALRLAIESLKKQIPKKPIVRTYGDSDLIFYDCFCPNCSFMFGSNLNYIYSRVAHHHCICGQAMDWSEE